MMVTPDFARLTVLDYLAAMEARELERAKSLLSDDPRLSFPGDRTFCDLESLVESSDGRYRHIAKCIERTESWSTTQGVAVLVSGTLEGVWADGRQFEGIRFVDRFELVDGRIVRQEVWNDVAEHRAMLSQPGER